MAKYKINQWKELITEWQTSGKTREKFCTEKDVTVATFSYWRTKKSRLGSPSDETQEQSTFVQYPLPPTLTGGYLIEWLEGMKLRLPPGIGTVEIASQVAALRSQR